MARPEQVPHGWMHGRIFELNEDVMGRDWHGHGADPEWTDVPMPKGTQVKVVMVSRLGDCGITIDHSRENGYQARVMPSALLPEVHPSHLETEEHGGE